MASLQNGGGGKPGVDVELFESLERYPWDSDEEFQSGLEAILGQDPDPSQAEALTLRAQCFYFTRKFGTPVDFPTYQEWHSQRPIRRELNQPAQAAAEPQHSDSADVSSQPGPPIPQEEKPPYPVSFSHVVELISTGQPIPGIKDIPDTVLEGQASQSLAQVRKKPWEP